MVTRKHLSLFLALCMALGLITPVQVRAADESEVVPVETAYPTEVKAVEYTAEAVSWPVGAEKPAALTVTTANVFYDESSSPDIYLKISGLPEKTGSWYVWSDNPEDNSCYSFHSDGSGTDFCYYYADGRKGALNLNLTIQDSYPFSSSGTDGTGYSFRLTGLSTYIAGKADFPLLTMDDMENETEYTSDSEAAISASLAIPDGLAPDGKVWLRAVGKDGAVYAGTGYGYNPSDTAYYYAGTQRDPRYDEIFSGERSFYTPAARVSGSMGVIKKLTEGSYDVIVVDAEENVLACVPDAVIVTPEPVVDSIYAYNSYRILQGANVAGGKDAYVEVRLKNADPKDFTVSVRNKSKTVIGTSDYYRYLGIYNGEPDVVYHVALSEPLERNTNYTAEISSGTGKAISGNTTASIYPSECQVSIEPTSMVYASWRLKCFGAVPEDACVARLVTNTGNAAIAETPVRFEPSGDAEIVFSDENGEPLRLAASTGYNVYVYVKTEYGYENQIGNSYAWYQNMTLSSAVKPDSPALASLMGEGLPINFGSIYASDGIVEAYLQVNQPDNTGYDTAGSYTLKLTNRVGETTELTGTAVEYTANSSKTTSYWYIDFPLPEEETVPNGYYSVALFYAGTELLRENGSAALDNSGNFYLSRFPSVYSSSRRLDCGQFLVYGAGGRFLGNSALTVDLYRQDNQGGKPDATLNTDTKMSGRNVYYQFSGTMSVSPRERYYGIIKADGAEVGSWTDPEYIYLPGYEAARNSSFTVSADQAEHGTVKLISSPGGETVENGTKLEPYSEVFVNAVPEEGYHVAPGGIRVNGEPVYGRGFLLTENSTVSVTFTRDGAAPAAEKSKVIVSDYADVTTEGETVARTDRTWDYTNYVELLDVTGKECVEFAPGETVYVRVIPISGTVSGVSYSYTGGRGVAAQEDAERFSFTMPETGGDFVTVRLAFHMFGGEPVDQDTFFVSVNQDNCVVAISGATTGLKPGATVSFTVTPDEGFEDSGSVYAYAMDPSGYSGNLKIEKTDKGYSFVMPANNVTLFAYCNRRHYPAPGGDVNSVESLLKALGSDNAKRNADGSVLLVRSVRLEQPLNFTGGNLTLLGESIPDAAAVGYNIPEIESPGNQSAVIVSGSASARFAGGFCVFGTCEKPAVELKGGSLTLEGVEVYVKKSTGDTDTPLSADAVLVTGGSLTLGKQSAADTAANPNQAYENLNLFGNGSGHALHITGGSVVIESGHLDGGSYFSEKNDAATATGGHAIYVEGGSLTVNGGYFWPGSPRGSALYAKSADRLLLAGGSFETREEDSGELDENGSPIWKILAPSIRLPAGTTLQSVLGEDCDIVLNNNPSNLGKDAVLAASEVMASISILPGVDETTANPITFAERTAANPVSITLKGVANPKAVAAGTQVSFTASADAGWRVESVYLVYNGRAERLYQGTDGAYAFVMPDAEVEIVAKAAERTYTVTFLDWNGAVIDTQEIALNADAKQPSDPERDGYQFKDWLGDYENVTSDRTVIAQYEKTTCTVELFSAYGLTAANQRSYTVSAGGTIASLPEPEYSGYTFEGWYTQYSGGERFIAGTTKVSADLILYARWTRVAAHSILCEDSGVTAYNNSDTKISGTVETDEWVYFVVTPPADKYLKTLTFRGDYSNRTLSFWRDGGSYRTEWFLMPGTDITVTAEYGDAGALRIKAPEGVSSISVYGGNPWVSEWYDTYSLDADRTLTVANLPEQITDGWYSGEYQIYAYGDQEHGWYTVNATAGVTKGQTTDVTLPELPKLYRASGKITVSGGEPLPANFWLYARDEQNGWYYASVESNGNFTFYGLPNGTYTVTGESGSANYPFDQSFTIQDGNQIGLAFTMTRPCDLQVRLSANGALAESAKRISLMLEEKDGDSWIYKSYKTDSAANGTVVLFEDALEEGRDYRVSVDYLMKSNYTELAFTSQPQEFTATGDKTQEHNLSYSVLDPTVSLQGLVAVTKPDVYPGETLDLIIRYRNAPAAPSFDITLPAGITAEKTNAGGDAGTGTIYVPLTVGKEASGTYRVSVAYGGKEFGAVSLNVAKVTLNAPASVEAGKAFKVSGEAAPGVTVTVLDAETGKKLGATQVKDRFYTLDVTLSDAGSVRLAAECTVNGVTMRSDAAAVMVTENRPITIKSVVYDGQAASWNTRLEAYSFYCYVNTELLGGNLPLSVTFDNGESITEVVYSFCGLTGKAVKNNGAWNYTFPAYEWGGSGLKNITAEVTLSDGTKLNYLVAIVNLLIDPSGTVTDSAGKPLAGVTVTCEVLENGEWIKWDAESSGQVNPQVTGDDGKYGWYVPEGTYRVLAEKDGYEPYNTMVKDFVKDGKSTIIIPPPRMDIDFTMISNRQYAVLPGAAAEGIQVTASSSTAKQGDQVTLTAATQLKNVTLSLKASKTQEDVAYTENNGTYTFTMPEEDVVYLFSGPTGVMVEKSSLTQTDVILTNLNQNALLMAALYDTASGRMLTMGSASVSANDTSAAVTFADSVQASSVTVRVFLLDPVTRTPLASADSKVAQ